MLLCLNQLRQKEKVLLCSEEDFALILPDLSQLASTHGSLYVQLQGLFSITKCFSFKAESPSQGAHLDTLGMTLIAKVNQIQFLEQGTDFALVRLLLQFLHLLVSRSQNRKHLVQLDNAFKKVLFKLLLDLQKNPHTL